MATKYGTEATKYFNQTIKDLAEKSQLNGRIHVLYDEYIFTADLAVNDVMVMGGGYLPQGARVLDVICDSPDLDSAAAGALTVGWAASPDLDSSGTTLEAASSAGFLSSMDVNTAGKTLSMSTLLQTAVAGKYKKFAGRVQVQVKITGETNATTGTVRCAVYYLFD